MGECFELLCLIWEKLIFAIRPPSVTESAKQRLASKENGLPPVGELDPATRQKAEARYFNFYELWVDPDPEAQGAASFN